MIWLSDSISNLNRLTSCPLVLSHVLECQIKVTESISLFQAFIPLLLTVLIGTMAVGEEDQEAGWTTFQRPATQSTRQPNVDDDIVDIDVNYIETCDTLNTTLIYLDNGDELELLGKVTVVFRIVPHFLYHDQVEM